MLASFSGLVLVFEGAEKDSSTEHHNSFSKNQQRVIAIFNTSGENFFMETSWLGVDGIRELNLEVLVNSSRLSPCFPQCSCKMCKWLKRFLKESFRTKPGWCTHQAQHCGTTPLPSLGWVFPTVPRSGP